MPEVYNCDYSRTFYNLLELIANWLEQKHRDTFLKTPAFCEVFCVWLWLITKKRWNQKHDSPYIHIYPYINKFSIFISCHSTFMPTATVAKRRGKIENKFTGSCTTGKMRQNTSQVTIFLNNFDFMANFEIFCLFLPVFGFGWYPKSSWLGQNPKFEWTKIDKLINW